MRADIHDGPEQMLQSKAGYIDARPPPPIRRNLLATHGQTIHLGQKAPFRTDIVSPPRHVSNAQIGDVTSRHSPRLSDQGPAAPSAAATFFMSDRVRTTMSPARLLSLAILLRTCRTCSRSGD